MFYFSIFVVLMSGQLVAGKTNEKSLGTGFDISQEEIGKNRLPKGFTIFKSIPHFCVLSHAERKSQETWEHYKNTEEMVRSYKVSAGISAAFLSLVTLGASLSSTYKKDFKTDSSISGAKHVYYVHTHTNYVDNRCLQEMKLDERFKKDFMALPKDIREPHKSSSWQDYRIFLMKYGTHIVKKVTYGSSVSQYLSAKSSHDYTERQFLAKACLDVTVPAQVGVVKAGACGGVSRDEQHTATSYEMRDEFIVLGGRRETRHKIIKSRNLMNIERLLNEGHKYKSPVSYKFHSIADLLVTRYSKTEFSSQAVNLKSYVEGFINFGCSYKNKNGIGLQKFELKTAHMHYPQYVCTLAPEGCNKNSDCRFRGKCKCRGDTCVRHHQSPALNGYMKTTAMINNSTRPGVVDKYCSLSLLGCKCKRPPYVEREEVWSPKKMKKMEKKARAKIMKNFSLY